MKDLTEFMKCLSDETRLKILRLLKETDLCVCEMVEALKVPQARVSQHLHRLRREGLVDDCREGQWVVYSLNEKALRRKLKKLKKFLFASPEKNSFMHDEFMRLENLEGCKILKGKRSSSDGAPDKSPKQAPTPGQPG